MDTKMSVRESAENDDSETNPSFKQPQYQLRIKWFNVLVYVYFHVAALYGLYMISTFQCRLYTFLFRKFMTLPYWVPLLNVTLCVQGNLQVSPPPLLTLDELKSSLLSARSCGNIIIFINWVLLYTVISFAIGYRFNIERYKLTFE